MKSPLLKKRIMIIMVLLVILSAALFVLAAYNSKSEPLSAPLAAQGILDLRQWDFEQQGIVNLKGEWEFYWRELLDTEDFSRGIPQGQLVQVPNVWTDYKQDGQYYPGEGYATYRLIVRTQGAPLKLALKIPDISTACKVMVEGQLVANCGTVADQKADADARYAPQTVHFQTSSAQFDIIVQVSNYLYDRGGMWYALDLGSEQQINRMRENEMAMDLILLGIFFFMGIYHFIIYILRPKEKAALFFAVGCLIGTLRLFVTGEIFLLNLYPGASVQLITAIIYLTYYGGVMVLTLYLRQLYPQEIAKSAARAAAWTSTAFMLSVFLLPLSLYTHMIRYYHLIMILLGLYLITCVLLAAWRRRDGARLQFLGISFFVFTIFHDILFNLFYISKLINHANTIQFLSRQIVLLGLLVLVFVQAIILARRFAKAFLTVEQLSEKLLSLDRLKDEFLMNTSHELKTPLHGIINLSQSMLEGSTGSLNEAQRRNLSLMVSVSRRLTNLINDILDFSKLRNNEITLQRRGVSLRAVLQANQEVFIHYMDSKPLQLILQLPDDLPDVYVDENRLLQIFYNLIGNAIKFTEAGQIIVSAVQREQMIEVSVRDTGIGIPTEKQEIIFQSFEQKGTTVSREYGGTGLGLSITKQLVELFGGQLRVSSEVGVGSQFTFTLPISADGATTTEPFVASTSQIDRLSREASHNEINRNQSGSCIILAVDDDPTNLQVILNVFAQESCQILTARHGEEALEIITRNPNIDIVIMDVMMPRLSGYEVCRRIRERYTLFELPILLVTVKNEVEDLASGFAAGANDFLVKPFYTDELRARTRTLMELKKSVQEAIQSEASFLRAQIKPHFLYNALNTIVSICPRNPYQAVELLTELSSYLRSSFDFESKEKLVSLEKELELVESYLYIEKARFGDRLNVLYDIEPELVCLLPPLSIQPLVENAVRHGLMNQLEGGTIKVKASSDEHEVLIVVEDDGIGMSQETRHSLLTEDRQEKGIGLYNIDQRLKRMYGYGVKIESETGIGTKVTVKIPKQTS